MTDFKPEKAFVSYPLSGANTCIHYIPTFFLSQAITQLGGPLTLVISPASRILTEPSAAKAASICPSLRRWLCRTALAARALGHVLLTRSYL